MGSRRRFLKTLAGLGIGSSGCLTSTPQAKRQADVIAGPNSRLTFDPEEMTITVGQRVTWYFDSNGHNVCGDPNHSTHVVLPDGAAPFASYTNDNNFRTIPSGETFSHTFETPGTYTYVCIPHQPDMMGTLQIGEK